MDRREVTYVVIFGVTGLLIVYDVWAAFEPGATISERMLDMGHRHPVIPFAIGILMGHFFWSQTAEADWQKSVIQKSPGAFPVTHTHGTLLWVGLTCLLVGILLAILVR
jgi:hypothetical protein